QDQLGRAAELLREAARLTRQPTLERFLTARADAFLSNDYFQSDVAWMELDSSIEPTIGPYEVYTDNWFNQKAAFEAFITLIDGKETATLARLSADLQGIEDALPIDPQVRKAMQEAGSALEEAKADISGLFALQLLVDKGALDRSLERTMYVTFLASAFRSIRFGTNEAHGKGVALQLNTLLDAGAVRVAPDGTLAVVPERIRQAVAKLTGEIMTLQASGDEERAREWLRKLGVVRPEVKRVLDKLAGVPVDIEPRFTAADKLRSDESR